MGLIRTLCAWMLIIGVNMFISNTVFAGYSGPTEVVSGGWGVNNDQFGIKYSDTLDQLPRSFGIAADGYIVISDTINRRIKVYTFSGSLLKIITPQGLSPEVMKKIHNWPVDIAYFVANNYVVTMSGKYTQLYSFDGSLMGNYTYPTMMGSVIAVLQDGSLITVGGTNYYKYSSSGQLLQSYNTKPPDLGLVEKTSKRPDGSYKLIVRYPDRVYSIITPGQSADRVCRDSLGYLYAIQSLTDHLNPGTPDAQDIQHYRIIRYSYCGKETGRIELPQDVYQVLPEQPIIGVTQKVLSEYGDPVIAPNGDVYTWKRTPDKYSILKWTWVDDPNVPTGPEPPTNLSLTPSINGLYLTWQASPNDPGCVTKYEIARATTSGGLFSTIDTVEKGVLKYNDTTAEVGTTYYYKVRAMAGSDPSLYTAEVSGKR